MAETSRASLVFANLLADPLGGNLVWEPFREGVKAAWLYRTPDGGPAAALLHYQPGVRIPNHRHVGWETMIMLRGSQRDGSGHHLAGAVVANPPDTLHAGDSPDGCVVLLIWERQPELLS